MIPLTDPYETTLAKTGAVLVGELPGPVKGSKVKRRNVPQGEWDSALAEHVATMAEGESVKVKVVQRTVDDRAVSLAGVASLATIPLIEGREEALRGGGFVNPYTFVPAPPRDELKGEQLGDHEPASHAVHRDGQYSGTLTLTLTTVTPLLLPVRSPEQNDGERAVFDVRLDSQGRPLIHGASFKGALRSAFEAVTASRFGVFFGHAEPLVHRATAGSALDLVPARVCRPADSPAYFRLCQGDGDWTGPCASDRTRNGDRRNAVQLAAWIPAYKHQDRLVRRLGELDRGALTDHHEKRVHARVVLCQYSSTKRSTRFRVWRATHLALTREEIEKLPPSDPRPAGNLTPVPGIKPRIVAGWLSASGYSIDSKHDERLFVETPGVNVPITDEHQRYWRLLLDSYDEAARYHDSNDTKRPGDLDVQRSRHVNRENALRDLPDGTLVYVRCQEGERGNRAVTEVHPVMIGRLPFRAAPENLLPASVLPAQSRHELSPADRLFGWVPQRPCDDGQSVNDGASGYRGRLVVRSITCTTEDWLPESFPDHGVVLAPLSSPKPTQARFYAAADSSGLPVDRGQKKSEGYAPGGGLRGRKAYRWREEDPGYWQPPSTSDNDPLREYLALKDAHKPKQTARHRGWVRPGATFEITLFLDGVDRAELGALLWLLTHAGRDQAPLRLGAGKPYGFGVVAAQVDWDTTRLWDTDGVRNSWLHLTRPARVSADRLTELAEEFAAAAEENRVLREATQSYLAAARPVNEPVHYPRKSTERQAENYEWFVANDRIKRNHVEQGWALPHVRDSEPRLPY